MTRPTQGIVSETEVLIATLRWLSSRGARPLCISIPSGQGTSKDADRGLLNSELNSLGLAPCRFSNDGPDIVACSSTEYWQIECKGVGAGVQQTQRNNFDRALASVVSYYCDQVPNPNGECPPSAKPLLALALPATSEYLNQLRRRVRRPLRAKLDLWILLYEPSANSLKSLDPVAEYEGGADLHRRRRRHTEVDPDLVVRMFSQRKGEGESGNDVTP